MNIVFRRPLDKTESATDALPPQTGDPMGVGVFARKLLAQRRRREQILGADLFGEPIWDMFLDLFANAAEGRQVSVSSLCIASGAPTTTALRYIATLVDRGLLLRTHDARDGRRVLIELSPMVHEKIGHMLLSWMENDGA